MGPLGESQTPENAVAPKKIPSARKKSAPSNEGGSFPFKETYWYRLEKNRSWGSTSENLEAWGTVGEFPFPNSPPFSCAPFPLARRSCRRDLTLHACVRAQPNVEARSHIKCLSQSLSTLFFKAGSIHEPGVHESATWMASELQGPSCLHLQGTAVTN